MLRIAELEVSYKPTKSKYRVTDSHSAYLALREMWDEALINIQEQFCVLFLNNANEVLGFRCLSTGTQTSSIVDVKFLFSMACKVMAKGIIIAHNHPSGNPNPSKQDRDITDRIKQAGELLDIQLLDHIILLGDDYISFKDQNML